MWRGDEGTSKANFPMLWLCLALSLLMELYHKMPPLLQSLPHLSPRAIISKLHLFCTWFTPLLLPFPHFVLASLPLAVSYLRKAGTHLTHLIDHSMHLVNQGSNTINKHSARRKCGGSFHSCFLVCLRNVILPTMLLRILEVLPRGAISSTKAQGRLFSRCHEWVVSILDYY